MSIREIRGSISVFGFKFPFSKTKALLASGIPRQQGRIPQWRSAGYLVKLYFMTLPDPEFAIRRVERRVRFGGHDIPAATIRRRFHRGLENLRNHYLGIVDETFGVRCGVSTFFPTSLKTDIQKEPHSEGGNVELHLTPFTRCENVPLPIVVKSIKPSL